LPQDALAGALHDGAPDAEATADSTAYDDLIGKTIAHNFQIVRRIGSGGMGRVYEAEQLSLGKRVAIKILRREFMGDERVLTRFELEARAVAAINHPNLVQIFDCGRDVDLDLVYIAMELLPGRDLSQLIQREWPLPLQRVVHIVDDVLAALDEAHAQGIVHRDLKPGNIMLVPRRNQADLVKVLDFGIAKAPQSRGRHNPTMAGFVFGTPEYMAPEQARGEAVDGRTDLYAVAAILYQLLTGEIPLPAPSPPEILARLLRDEPERPSARGKIHLPETLEDLLMRGLSKSPNDRPQNASQFRDELREALVGIVDWWPGQTGTNALPGPITPNGTRAPSPVMARPAVGGPGLSVADLITPPPRGPMAAPGMPPAGAPLAAAGTTAVLRPKSHGKTFLGVAVLAVGGFIAAGKAQVLPAAWNPFAVKTDSAAASHAPATTSEPRLANREAAATATRPAAPIATAAPAEPSVEAAPSERPADNGDKRQDGDAQSTHGKKPANKGRPEKPVRHASGPEKHAAHEAAPAPTAAPAATAPAPVAAAPAEEKPVVESRPTREEPMREAERLLSQGEVEQACRKGEEARRAAPKTPSIYKFLGKCYMRAGKAGVAQDNYKHYLELAPDAPDAAFIRSYVK